MGKDIVYLNGIYLDAEGASRLVGKRTSRTKKAMNGALFPSTARLTGRVLSMTIRKFLARA